MLEKRKLQFICTWYYIHKVDYHHLSHIMRKQDFAYAKMKAQFSCASCTADQHLCLHYLDSTILLVLKHKISSFCPSSVDAQAGLCQTWSETPKTVFLMTRLIYMSRLMGKPTICIGENKDADQLRGNREADQRLCFRYLDSTIPPLLNSKISSF